MDCGHLLCLYCNHWDGEYIARIAGPRNLIGTWQGTLRAGARKLRIVIKISNDTGGLKALMYSIDQGPGSNPSSAVTVQDSNVKISFPAIGGVYEGKLTVDGNSLTGTWTQLQTVPFNLMRATADTAWAIPEPPGPPKPMAAALLSSRQKRGFDLRAHCYKERPKAHGRLELDSG